MRKIFKCVVFFVMILAVFGFLKTAADRYSLREQLVRLHVVANSDSDEDQAVKQEVRDAVIQFLQPALEKITDTQQAKEFLSAHLGEIKDIADAVLQKSGKEYTASVSLQLEEFGKRVYETFSLPSGVYESLRIKLGDAEGKNWWCVVFPALCLPAEKESFCETAASYGMQEDLANTLTGEDGYEIRFFLLDCFGKIENFFFRK